jgi:hypothetical protein
MLSLASPLRSSTSPPSPQTADLLSPKSATHSPLRSPALEAQSKDFSFLLQPQNFLMLPTPILKTADVDDSPASLPRLIETGHFYSAAVLSARAIQDLPSSTEPLTVFNLWYARLTCLCLIHQTTIAAQESKVLGDMTSPFYRDSKTNQHLVPWDLRVLVVRLQALGFGESRRGIMAYYVLAQDAREEAAAAKEAERQSDVRLWKARLHDLAIRVASALVEMGDCDAAAHHLRSLQTPQDIGYDRHRMLTAMETLTWMTVGDLDAASQCLSRISQPIAYSNLGSTDEQIAGTENDYVLRVLQALLTTSDGEYATAIQEWQSLGTDYPEDLMIRQNLAVCQLYTCEMPKSREAFESIVGGENPSAFQSVLFNLASLYELSTESAPALKVQLAERLASAGQGPERAATEFKL